MCADIAESATTELGSGISRIRRTRTEAKPTPSQLPCGGLVLVAVAGLGAVLCYGRNEPRLAFIWMIAVALGLTLQRARFCFTAAMRDPVLTGGTNLTKAVIGGLATYTDEIVNYPGFPEGTTGLELMKAFEAQTRKW